MARAVAVASTMLLTILVVSCGPTNQNSTTADVHESVNAPIAPKVATERETPVPKTKPPERPPEIFGVVERVEKLAFQDGKEFDQVLIKGHLPLPGRPEPSEPLFFRDGQPDRLWLNLPNTTVESRSGPFTVGQYVWVWYDGTVFDTDPGQIYPEYVISEAVSPK